MKEQPPELAVEGLSVELQVVPPSEKITDVWNLTRGCRPVRALAGKQ